MSPLTLGTLGCVLLLLLLATRLPAAFAMAVAGGIGFACIVKPAPALSMMSAELYNIFTSPSLTVIPLFVFMGQVAFHSGLSRRLYDAAYHWLGPLPGGLAMATVGACTGFGAICGSGPATAATMASVAVPEMRRYHYDLSLACGVVAAGGSLGMLVPPSVVLIVYAIMTEQSVGELFLAGIVPGLVVAVVFCFTILAVCIRNPALGPAAPRVPWRGRFVSLLGVSEILALFLLVMGGMFSGLFTPTEAAAVGAAGSLVIAAIRRQLNLSMLRQSLEETVRTSCMVLMLVAGATIFGRFLAVSLIPVELAEWLSALPLPGFLIVACIVLFYLVAGLFVDALALILLTTSIFYPVITGLGYSPIWFGVITVLVVQMGVISPPVGVNVYVVSGIVRDVPLRDVFRGALPFLAALIVSVGILMAFPQISLALPALLQ